jgi:hypothetical protein
MKKALISPNEAPIKHIVSWTTQIPPSAVYEDYPNSCRVAEVAAAPFEVAPPFFWVDCADDVVADQFYFNTSNQIINPVVNAPAPEPIPPISTGVQTA